MTVNGTIKIPLATRLAQLRELLTSASIIAHRLPDTPLTDSLCDSIERNLTDVQVLITQERGRKFTDDSGT